MSLDSPSSASSDLPPAGSGLAESDNGQPNRVILVSYPNIVFLYPTVLTSLLCSVFMWAKGDIPADEVSVAAGSAQSAEVAEAPKGSRIMRAAVPFQEGENSASTEADDKPAETTSDTPSAAPPQVSKHTYHHVCARIFLAVFALNMVVIAFDFPRTTSLTWFFALAAVAIGAWFMLTSYPGLAPRLMHGLLRITPAANASFYMIYTLIMLFLYMCVMISRRFDYWEVKGNELLHHHGFLSNLERFAAPNLRIDKEISDLFEYILLRSGRLIIHASNERRAIVLDNILMISSKEERITKMLGALQVRVRTDKE